MPATRPAEATDAAITATLLHVAEQCEATARKAREALGGPAGRDALAATAAPCKLSPAEGLALTVARAQAGRGENPPINTTVVLIQALERLTGGPVMTVPPEGVTDEIILAGLEAGTAYLAKAGHAWDAGELARVTLEATAPLIAAVERERCTRQLTRQGWATAAALLRDHPAMTEESI